MVLHMSIGSGTGQKIVMANGPTVDTEPPEYRRKNQSGMSQLSLDSVTAGNVGVSGSTIENIKANDLDAEGNTLLSRIQHWQYQCQHHHTQGRPHKLCRCQWHSR